MVVHKRGDEEEASLDRAACKSWRLVVRDGPHVKGMNRPWPPTRLSRHMIDVLRAAQLWSPADGTEREMFSIRGAVLQRHKILVMFNNLLDVPSLVPSRQPSAY